MKNLFKFFSVLFVFLGCITMNAQQLSSLADISPNHAPKDPKRNIEAMWDVLLNFDISALNTAAGNAGAEWNGTYFYSTRWASNLIHEYNSTGTTLIREFSVPGVSGLRDLAWDGTYMYGGAAANTIYQMDFATNTLVGTIPSPVGVRHIAYDVANDAFWVGNWDTPPTLVDRSGTVLATINTGLSSQYGTAYDNVSAGGPFLWVWDQGSGAGTPQLIHQFHIPTGTATGVTHDVGSDVGSGSFNGIAGGLFSMCDWQSGTFTIGGCWQGGFATPPDNDRIFVYEITTCGPPCPVDPPTNPNPPNGTTGVAINPGTISWTNGAGTIYTDVYFGPSGNMQQVYSGAAVTSWNYSWLNYNTTYGWRIVARNDTCGVNGPTWTFATQQDPNLIVAFYEPFNDLNCWTWIGPLGNNWALASTANAGGAAPELELYWSPQFVGMSQMLSCNINSSNAYSNHVQLKHYLDFYASPAPEMGLAVTYDGGTTSNVLWSFTPTGSVGPEVIDLNFTPVNSTFQLILYHNGDSYNINWWDIDDIIVEYVIPVELSSFTALVYDNDVELNWITATETNNQGFEIERSAGDDFEKIAFVEGFGTTAASQYYTYMDKGLKPGNYTYRLRQIDFDGQFKYSDPVEVEVLAPKEFALGQNYPNPFNPTTKVDFNLADDASVSLKVFDVIGQEVLNVISSVLPAGVHSVSIDASGLNSGVYFYKLEAEAINGTKFVEVKKMILTK